MFLSEHDDSLLKLLSKIVVLSARTANCPANTRYLLQSVIAGHRKLYSCGSLRSSIQSSRTLSQLAEKLGGSVEADVEFERRRQLKVVRKGAIASHGGEIIRSGFCLNT